LMVASGLPVPTLTTHSIEALGQMLHATKQKKNKSLLVIR
jgi:hypothetical protein